MIFDSFLNFHGLDYQINNLLYFIINSFLEIELWWIRNKLT